MVSMQFNATQYAPRYDSTAGLTAGRHPVVIADSTFKPTKDSTPSDPRSFLELKLVAIDGPSKGGSIPDRLNIQHPNQQTVTIAYSQLAAYCAVTGRQGFNDTSELHNIPFLIEVGPQRNNDQYMEVKGVYFLDGRSASDTGQVPATSQQQPAQAPAYQAPQTAGGAPWGGGAAQPQGFPQTAVVQPPYALPASTHGAAQSTTTSPSNPAPAFQPGGAPPWGKR